MAPFFYKRFGLACLAAVSAGTAASSDIADPFREAEVVILGEVHDNPSHHATQAAIVELLQPGALVFEMIEPDQALSITAENRGNPSELDRALAWADRGWPDFAMYFPIFAAAPDAAVFGAALPGGQVRRAVKDGAAAAFGDAAVLFGLDRPLDQAQRQTRIDLQRDAHCDELPEELLPGMVEAQRLRDAALAEAVVAALEEAGSTDGAPQVVVITGNGHAREDWGVPQMLRTYFGEASNIDVRTLAQFEVSAPEAPPYSTWLTTEPAKRDDPCEELRK